MKPLVEIQNLVKYFDLGGNQRVHAVDDVSLSINPREIVGLVGRKRFW
jgi:ABC-type oligopeptide transport system ATPase subunit